MSSTLTARARRPVITVALGGGLGNQLFQYAFGRRMSLANDAELCIDASGFQRILAPDPERGVRVFGLDHFNIAGTILRERSRRNAPRPWLQRKFRKYLNKAANLLERRKPYYMRREVYEPEDQHFTFDAHVYGRRISDDVTFYGYWQTEKYFHEVEQLLRQELVVKDRLEGLNADLANEMSSTDSVSIHVRHGDNANAVATALGVLPSEYFQTSVSQLTKEVSQPHFYVFSDDIAWAQQLLRIGGPTRFVGHNGDVRNYEDLRLMSFCRHHIVGNSTFSWWGAWLGRKSGQIVYAPRRYWQNIDRPNPDLYPDTWRLIPE